MVHSRLLRTFGRSPLASLWLVIAGLLPACSERGEPGACHRESDNACIEFGAAQGAAGKRMCSNAKWLPGAKACPKEHRLGTCLKEGGKITEIVYSGAPNNFTPSGAKNACEWKGGVFTAPPPGAAP